MLDPKMFKTSAHNYSHIAQKQIVDSELHEAPATVWHTGTDVATYDWMGEKQIFLKIIFEY